jgi:hypothetical protein
MNAPKSIFRFLPVLISFVLFTGCSKDVTGPGDDNTIPAAPSRLDAKSVSWDRIELSWLDNSTNEEGFKIEVKSPGASTFEEKARVGANVTTYRYTGLQPKTTYQFRVKAFNSLGDSDPAEKSIKTTAITDTLYALKDATLLKTCLSYSGHTGCTYRNDQSSNKIGTHIEAIAGILTRYTYSTALYFGDIKQVVKSRNRKIAAADIIFDLSKGSAKDFLIHKVELTSNSWFETSVTLENLPSYYTNSEFYSIPFISNGKLSVGMKRSVELIVNSSRTHGGFWLYSDIPNEVNHFYSSSTSESSGSKRPMLVIEYE